MSMRISWLVLLFLALNIFAALQVGLTVDGAHYALYGEHLAWSYFDHPPLIGWLQALLLSFGQQDYLMRLWPLSLSLATIASLYYLAPRLWPNSPAYFSGWCVITYYTAVILNLLAIDLVPQAPFLLLAFWISYGVYSVSQKASWHGWLGIGLGLGLAGLAEYTAVLIALGLIIYLLLYQRWQFATVKPYVAALLALICITPVIFWNWQHQWISFQYQLHHGFGKLSWEWLRFIKSIAIQILVYGPALFIFGLLGAWQALRTWQDVGSRILACLGLPVLLMFTYTSGYQLVLPHWTAVGWLLLIPLAVRYVIMHWHAWWVKGLSYFAIGFVIVVYSVIYTQVAWNWLPFPIGKGPLVDLYGWRQAAQHAKNLLKTVPTKSADAKPYLFVNNWTLASRLAWYAQQPVQVASLGGLSQFDLWYGRPNTQSQGILVVPENWHQPATHSQVMGEFANCQKLDSLPIMVKDKLFNVFYFYYCRNFNT